MSRIRTINLSSRSKIDVLHIEAPGCVINVRPGLTSFDGHNVTSISVLPDGVDSKGHQWIIADRPQSRAINVRVTKVPTFADVDAKPRRRARRS